jgi:acyl carrier protein
MVSRMSQMSTGSDVMEVQRWLIERVALYLEKRPEDINPALPLAEMGMDSIYALSLCGDIEDNLKLDVEPTLAWDHPSIEAIARYLVSQTALLDEGR